MPSHLAKPTLNQATSGVVWDRTPTPRDFMSCNWDSGHPGIVEMSGMPPVTIWATSTCQRRPWPNPRWACYYSPQPVRESRRLRLLSESLSSLAQLAKFSCKAGGMRIWKWTTVAGMGGFLDAIRFPSLCPMVIVTPNSQDTRQIRTSKFFVRVGWALARSGAGGSGL